MKVSDEFTVPLCSVRHDAVHRVGNERSWWVAQAIDPRKPAAELWDVTMRRISEGDVDQSSTPSSRDSTLDQIDAERAIDTSTT
jgi:hypothetical protein